MDVNIKMVAPLTAQDLASLLLTLIFLENFFVLAIYIGGKAFKSYRQTKATGTFFFSVSVIAVALAIILLLFERILIIFLVPDYAAATYWGLLVAQIAMIFSGIATVSIAIFAFNMAFDRTWKILSLIATVLMVVYLFFWFYGPIGWSAELEIIPSDIALILLYALDLPLIIIPALVFFYSAIKTRTESPGKSRMAAFMGLGLVCFVAATAIELSGISFYIGIFDIALIGRFLYIPAIIFYYWGLFRVKGE